MISKKWLHFGITIQIYLSYSQFNVIFEIESILGLTMTKQEIKQLIKEELPSFFQEDSELRDYILKISNQFYAGKQETESSASPLSKKKKRMSYNNSRVLKPPVEKGFITKWIHYSLNTHFLGIFVLNLGQNNTSKLTIICTTFKLSHSVFTFDFIFFLSSSLFLYSYVFSFSSSPYA